MIVNNEDAIKRLVSPINLINQLKSSSSRSGAMSLFGIGRKKEEILQELKEVKVSFNPFEAPKALAKQEAIIPQVIPQVQSAKLDEILENHESQIKLGLAHDKALDLLNRSVEMLSSKLDDVNASKLPAVISAASKTVESIRKERSEAAKNNKDRDVHFHFYTPEQKKISDYEVIDVT